MFENYRFVSQQVSEGKKQALAFCNVLRFPRRASRKCAGKRRFFFKEIAVVSFRVHSFESRVSRRNGRRTTTNSLSPIYRLIEFKVTFHR